MLGLKLIRVSKRGPRIICRLLLISIRIQAPRKSLPGIQRLMWDQFQISYCMSWSRYHVKVKRNSFGGPGFGIFFQLPPENICVEEICFHLSGSVPVLTYFYDGLLRLCQCPHMCLCVKILWLPHTIRLYNTRTIRVHTARTHRFTEIFKGPTIASTILLKTLMSQSYFVSWWCR